MAPKYPWHLGEMSGQVTYGAQKSIAKVRCRKPTKAQRVVGVALRAEEVARGVTPLCRVKRVRRFAQRG